MNKSSRYREPVAACVHLRASDAEPPFLNVRGETPVNFANVAEKVDADLNPHASATFKIDRSLSRRSFCARPMRMRTT